MPLIKILHISSFSSEDAKQPAENLLGLETYKKWTCADPSEKKAIVILQLEKATQIHALDLGNNGSAFAEVLVGRSATPDLFEVLLGMSTFMTVPESKTWTNINRVRMFGKENFSKEAAAQKWDRVKVLCTQPYNKNEKYGLSFIKLHSAPEPKATPLDTPTPSASKAAPMKLGRFALKEETKDLPLGSLFLKRKATSPPAPVDSGPTPNAAAQARMASSALNEQNPPRNSHAASQGQGRWRKSPECRSSASGGMKRTTPTGRGQPPEAKKPRVVGEVEGGREEKVPQPFSKLMDGVVFTLSGFKNPFRGQLREKGTEMGAMYQGDWGVTCTHLVCAFPGTPKFSQVKGARGLIVKKEWILDSHSKRKKLPARKYRLSSGSDASSSEDERYNIREALIFKRAEGTSGRGMDVGGQRLGVDKRGKDQDASTRGERSEVGVAKGKDPRDDSTGQMHAAEEVVQTGQTSEVGMEEDQVEGQSSEVGMARRENPVEGQSSGVGVAEEEEEDPYGVSTDEEEVEVVKSKPLSGAAANEPSGEVDGVHRIAQGDDQVATIDGEGCTTTSLMSLPTFLSHCSCFLYGDLPAADCRILTRYIVAYGGKVVEYMGPIVTHVLTQENWDQNFDQALSENSALIFVKPGWVFACHQQQRCVSCQPYTVMPR